jgi:ATPase subunit of ABC transporter with duplicated ATPase domains
MATSKKSVDAVKKSVFAELAKQTGVAPEDVKKVLSTLGIDKHFAEANKLSGGLKAKNLLIGFRLSESTVSV